MTNNTSFKIALFYSLVILLAAVLLSSCSSSKNLSKSNSFIDSTELLNLRERAAQWSVDSTAMVNEKKQSEYQDIKFQPVPCPPQKIVIDSKNCKEDSLLKIILDQAAYINNTKNKIKMYADGAVEAEGNILNVTRSKEQLQKVAITIKKERDSAYELVKDLQAKLSKKQEIKEVEKKVTIFPWWMWLLIPAGALAWDFLKKKISITNIKQNV